MKKKMNFSKKLIGLVLIGGMIGKSITPISEQKAKVLTLATAAIGAIIGSKVNYSDFAVQTVKY